MAAPAIPPIRPGLTTSRGCTALRGRLIPDAITCTAPCRGSGNRCRAELVDLTT
jgi:hypothetical protein